MKLSILIKYLQDYEKKYGNVTLYSEKDDGRSSWVSPSNFKIEFKSRYREKEKKHTINDEGY